MSPPRHHPRIHTASLPAGAAAVMDTRTGRGTWHHLNPTAGRLWHRLASGVPVERAVEELVESFTAAGADRRVVNTDLRALVARLRNLELLSAPAAPAPPAPLDAPVVYLPEGNTVRPSIADRAAGIVALPLALILLRLTPIRVPLAVVRAAVRIPRPRATATRAAALHLSVRRAGRWWPGRAACLEESLACTIAALLRGLHVTWVIGARTAPAAAHAWIETEDRIIGQDAEDRVWPYAPAVRL
ncbi:lasso peptide biosynthesis B2 protein [Streptomyces alkaliphilus]|uniref:lasso peptide biosynthesis B2 protein n=1 Tax=Streptomyces alkaliphilus TaxID=1472722 RepID=UPI0011807222|nr:lasso peptide biosynthesis B2 protein [Streptomyces alkaliphilus]MQS06005.1 lasso peptide biosynthesis B2 protein [Streptomyces alkaliphilus]